MSHVIVVGGSGFIGTRLVQRLRSRYAVKIVDKVVSVAFPDASVIADVRSLPALKNAIQASNILINLAAEHRDDVKPVQLYDDVNVQGARNLCNVARELRINTLIFTSSVAVYGFAEIGTSEEGRINPYNDYGRTKAEAEEIYRAWQSEAPAERVLVIIRPTVVFGEQNRGNVYSLILQIASGRFVMVGKGRNRKSIAYVENVAAFIEYCLDFKPGVHIFNYVDKPDFTMNSLVSRVRQALGIKSEVRIRVPFYMAFLIGVGFDVIARLRGRPFSLSAIRVKKFCSNSVYESAAINSGFIAPVPIELALERTVRHEFIENHQGSHVYYSE
jgi:nucleoside-diphosphate-sugar epimerase